MKTTLFLLSLLLLAPTAKAEEQDKTNWQDENVLASVSVGTDGTPTDVLVTLPDASNTNRTDTLYTVKTALGLAWIANITNSKDSVYQADGKGYLPLYPHQKGFKNCTVELDADIDLTDHYWTPIGKTLLTPFYGTFDGNHKVVKGLKIEETDINTRTGLFGRLLGNACNLGIQVATAGIKVKGQQVNVGALAGYTTSAIQNCFAIGENGAAIEAEATSNGMLGGLIGQNIGGSITNCYAALDVKGIVGNSSIAYVGGLVGHNNGNINHVYATGKIEATGQTFYTLFIA